DVARVSAAAGVPGTADPLTAAATDKAALLEVARAALLAAGNDHDAPLREALAGPGPHRLDPETAARAFRVLRELGLVAGDTNAGGGVASVVSSEGTDLERSAAFRVYSKEHSEARSFLQSQKLP